MNVHEYFGIEGIIGNDILGIKRTVITLENEYNKYIKENIRYGFLTFDWNTDLT
jgi:hypothetical protein